MEIMVPLRMNKKSYIEEIIVGLRKWRRYPASDGGYPASDGGHS